VRGPSQKVLQNQKGFTIIELMVVLSILGILVSIAVASYNISLSRAKDVACRYNLRAIEDALVLYRNVNNRNPDSLDDLAPNYIKGGAELECPEIKQPYLYDRTDGVAKCSVPGHNAGSD
jgi:prepilin-type N-terminal cleavage/methylation domain-containing protein